MTFEHEVRKVVIRGNSSLIKTRVSLKNMMMPLEADDQRFLVECRAIKGGLNIEKIYDKEVVPTIENSISHLLDIDENMFKWLEKLPLQRGIEHYFHLKKETDHVNVRPYRYAHQ